MGLDEPRHQNAICGGTGLRDLCRSGLRERVALEEWRRRWPEVTGSDKVFDVVKFKIWGSLAELLRFQACR